MKNLQKMGGIAALYAGAAYVVGMLGFLLIVGWDDYSYKFIPVHFPHYFYKVTF